MNAIKELIEVVRKLNPYPKTVFTEPTEEEWEKLQKAIEDAGLVQDKFSASLARIVWINCCDTFIDTMAEILCSQVIDFTSPQFSIIHEGTLTKGKLKTKKDVRIAITTLQKIEKEFEE